MRFPRVSFSLSFLRLSSTFSPLLALSSGVATLTIHHPRGHCIMPIPQGIKSINHDARNLRVLTEDKQGRFGYRTQRGQSSRLLQTALTFCFQRALYPGQNVSFCRPLPAHWLFSALAPTPGSSSKDCPLFSRIVKKKRLWTHGVVSWGSDFRW